jgi:hypothetical protein
MVRRSVFDLTPVAVVGMVPQLGVVEGQDLQKVQVKGSEVAGDLVVQHQG